MIVCRNMNNSLSRFTTVVCIVHGNDLNGNRGEIASPVFPFPYIHRGDFSWRVTVDPERFVRLFFYPQFSLEHDPDSGVCISSLLVKKKKNSYFPSLPFFSFSTHVFFILIFILILDW